MRLNLSDVPAVDPKSFRETCIAACARGNRLVALLAVPKTSDVLGVLADDAGGGFQVLRLCLSADRRYPALSSELPQAQAFERELFEEHGIIPDGHPWLKPLRKHAANAHPFFRVDGSGIHEVAVGPVHAGIIEPGHFRFQCYGETVHHLEIQLGYQHRAAEALFLRSKPTRRLVIAESIAGDTVIGHAWAHVLALEALAGVEAEECAQRLRALALELERVSNHVGDLGALCNDVGYLPGASWFGRMRGEFLNLLMELSGNRYGRGLLRVGGVRFGVSAQQRSAWVERLLRVERDLKNTASLIFDEASVCARLEGTGAVSLETAQTLGLVGPVARASGCDRDARRDHPVRIYRSTPIPVALGKTADVMARAQVRWQETEHSMAFIQKQMSLLGEDASPVARPTLQPSSIAVGVVEGWRGEIVHVALTDAQGELSAYKVVDPSFHNWFGLTMALRGNAISDFPLCNKSFNLSYAGHDL